MKTADIVSRIYSDFAVTYRGAAQFVNSGALWNFCIQTISDPLCMEKITFANDLGIPPVRSLLLLYERTVKPNAAFEFSAQDSRCLGSLMGFVFRFVLGYQGQQERCAVNRYGVRTATRFLDGPEHSFE